MRSHIVLRASLLGLQISACSPSERACNPRRDHWIKPVNLASNRNIEERGARGSPHTRLINVSLDALGLNLNGYKADAYTLQQYLRRMHQAAPQPIVFLEVKPGTPCPEIERVRDIIDRIYKCQESNCAEGNLEEWRQLPVPPGGPVV